MSHPVTLAVYDLSNGLARQFSQSLIGRQLDGIWHTGIRVYGREFYFGGGICADVPGATPFGTPREVHDLGATETTLHDFTQFLAEVSITDFSPASYHLLNNNCNHFSDRCADFLLGCHIPEYIRSLPETAMASPMGQMLRPMIDSMHHALVQQSVGHEWTSPVNADAPTPTGVKPLTRAPITLASGNVPRIVSRLRQCDATLPPDADTVENANALVAFVDKTCDDEAAFPALDLLRISAGRHVHIAEHLVEHLARLTGRFASVDGTCTAASIMALRMVVNVLAHDVVASWLLLGGSERDSEKEDGVAECMSVVLEAACWGLCEASENAARRKAAALVLRNVGAARGRVDGDHGKDERMEGVVVRALYVAFRWVEEHGLGDNARAEEHERTITNIVIEALALLVEGDQQAWLVLQTLGLDVDTMLPADADLAQDGDEDLGRAVALLRHMAQEFKSV